MGIPKNIDYPRPLPTKSAHKGHRVAPGGLATPEQLAKVVLSFSMHPNLDRSTQDRVIAAGRSAVKH